MPSERTNPTVKDEPGGFRRYLRAVFPGCAAGAHRFEARYDKGPANVRGIEYTGFGGIRTVLDALRPVTYVRDVCVRCGTVIEREPEERIETRLTPAEDDR